MLQFIDVSDSGNSMIKPSARITLRLAILVALVCAAQAQDQSAQDQSLGDVARAQHQKKTSGKVIDDEEMAQRRASRGAGESALQCDADCEAAVKVAVRQDQNLKMSEEQLQTALAAGENELAQDDEWSQLLSEIQQQICHNRAGTGDPVKAKDIDRRVAKKLLDDVRDNMEIIRHMLDAPDNQAAINQAMDASRAKAVEQHIIKVQVDRAKRTCSASTSSTKTPASN